MLQFARGRRAERPPAERIMAEAVLTASQLATFDFARGAGAVQTPSSEDLARALEDLRKVQGSALIAGGVAVIHYGYERSTKDVDVLYAYVDSKILERLKPYFKLVKKLKSGWHKLEHRETGVRLELIPEAALGTYGFIPGPKTVGGDGTFISLLGLVWLKLVAGRSKDEPDVVELAKIRFGELEALREKLPLELRDRFAELLAQAKREIEKDPSRPPEDLAQGSDTQGVGEAPGRYGKKKRAARTKSRAAG